MNTEKPSPKATKPAKDLKGKENKATQDQPKEIGGFKDQGLLEPTRYGDWDVKGRCSDF